MLPILTFDPTRLTPSMGYVFDPKWLDPYESIVGMLWKFARANGVAGHSVVGQLTDDPLDVYAGVAPTSQNRRGQSGETPSGRTEGPARQSRP